MRLRLPRGSQLVFERKNCSGASFGTTKGVADFGSGLNLAKTEGLSWKCFSSVCIGPRWRGDPTGAKKVAARWGDFRSGDATRRYPE